MGSQLAIHQIDCPECDESFYVGWERGTELPTANESECVSCKTDIRIRYMDANEEDVLFTYEVIPNV